MHITEQQATNAPASIRIAGAFYSISKHTRADRAELEQFVKDRVMHPVDFLVEQAKKLAEIDPELSKEMIRQEFPVALQQARSYPPRWMTPQFREIIHEPEGAMRLLWLAIRRQHPHITLDFVDSLIALAHPDEIADATLWFINGVRLADTESAVALAEAEADPKGAKGEATGSTGTGSGALSPGNTDGPPRSSTD